jgi:hypothetical protein
VYLACLFICEIALFEDGIIWSISSQVTEMEIMLDFGEFIGGYRLRYSKMNWLRGRTWLADWPNFDHHEELWRALSGRRAYRK